MYILKNLGITDYSQPNIWIPHIYGNGLIEKNNYVALAASYKKLLSSKVITILYEHTPYMGMLRRFRYS